VLVAAEQAMEKEQAREFGDKPDGRVDEPENAECLEVMADAVIKERRSVARDGLMGRSGWWREACLEARLSAAV
jgi:hypothetical protein